MAYAILNILPIFLILMSRIKREIRCKLEFEIGVRFLIPPRWHVSSRSKPRTNFVNLPIDKAGGI